jgi:hypothetical protein
MDTELNTAFNKIEVGIDPVEEEDEQSSNNSESGASEDDLD